ncbi:MAG TPA: hypothetical protein VEK38_02955 [Candidatus Bathyarchaeia archaeon]|nr:hypothetical protein [Candidatus Bathyarchaeia archaeon]
MHMHIKIVTFTLFITHLFNVIHTAEKPEKDISWLIHQGETEKALACLKQNPEKCHFNDGFARQNIKIFDTPHKAAITQNITSIIDFTSHHATPQDNTTVLEIAISEGFWNSPKYLKGVRYLIHLPKTLISIPNENHTGKMSLFGWAIERLLYPSSNTELSKLSLPLIKDFFTDLIALGKRNCNLSELKQFFHTSTVQKIPVSRSCYTIRYNVSHENIYDDLVKRRLRSNNSTTSELLLHIFKELIYNQIPYCKGALYYDENCKTKLSESLQKQNDNTSANPLTIVFNFIKQNNKKPLDDWIENTKIRNPWTPMKALLPSSDDTKTYDYGTKACAKK